LAVFLGAWIANPRSGYVVTNLGAADPLQIREVLSLVFTCAAQPERVVYTDGGKAPFLIALDRAQALGYRPATVRASVEAFVRDTTAVE
jgi:hypothetical protein